MTPLQTATSLAQVHPIELARAEQAKRRLRALLYARVSHDPRKRGKSVGQQVYEMTDWSEVEGWDIAGTLRETDRSASQYARRSRDLWAEVAGLLASGTVDILVAWEVSRATRDMEDGVKLVRLCKRHGVLFGYAGRVYDLSDPLDEHRVLADINDAQKESGMTSLRVRRDQRRAAANGRPMGRVPYGYRRLYDRETGDLLGQVEHPDEGPVVREMARRFVAGDSARGIARDLNGRGLLPKPTLRHHDDGTVDTVQTEWTAQSVRRALRNPAYRAQRVHQGNVVGAADWPALIDGDQAAQIDARLDDPARRAYREPTDPKWLLTGIARCGACLAKMGRARGGHRRRHVYTCFACGRVVRDLERVDAYVTDLVVTKLERDDIGQDDPADLVPAAAAAKAQEAALQSQLDEALAANLAGKLSAVMLGRIEADLTPKIAAARREGRRAIVPAVVEELAGPGAKARWNAATVEQRREAVRFLVSVTIQPQGSGRPFDKATITVEPRL